MGESGVRGKTGKSGGTENWSGYIVCEKNLFSIKILKYICRTTVTLNQKYNSSIEY